MKARPVMLAWSDDLVVHGHLLARWIVDYVDLEESLAVGSIAQEELAHARALLDLCGLSGHDRDQRIFVRDPDDWSPSELAAAPQGDWPSTVAAAFLFTTGVLTLLDGLGGDGTVPVMRTEQELHAMHWGRWVRILARDGTREEFERALVRAADLSADLFGEPAATSAVATPDADLDLAALHARWADMVRARLEALDVAGLQVPHTARPRRRGSDLPYLRTTLATMRSVRTANPGRVYAVYE